MTTETRKKLTNGATVVLTRGRGMNPNAPRQTHWTARTEDGAWLAEGSTMREAIAAANAL